MRLFKLIPLVLLLLTSTSLQAQSLSREQIQQIETLVPEGINDTTPSSLTKLVLLNLWGCHKLTDAAASLITGLPHLNSLCVSECHGLTDQFISEIN